MAHDNLLIVAAGALPALIAMWYYDRLDARRPEPRSLRRKVAIYSALAVIPVLLCDAGLARLTPAQGTLPWAMFQAFVMAAGVEELFKLLVLRRTIWRRPEFDERMDGIVYGARAGLGFALVENVLYLFQAAGTGGLLATFVARAVLAVPGHAIWGAFTGYYGAIRRFDGRGPGLFGGYLLAVLLHGSYDAAIFLQPVLRRRGHGDEVMALLLVPVAIVLGGAIALRSRARSALAADDADAARAMVGADAIAIAGPPPGYPA